MYYMLTIVYGEYLQAHPDARSYKTKSVQNFSDLCLIYGYTTADGRYSRSSHDVDIDDEVHGVSLGVFLSLRFGILFVTVYLEVMITPRLPMNGSCWVIYCI